jgi:hypothetical protein
MGHHLANPSSAPTSRERFRGRCDIARTSDEERTGGRVAVLGKVEPEVAHDVAHLVVDGVGHVVGGHVDRIIIEQHELVYGCVVILYIQNILKNIVI